MERGKRGMEAYFLHAYVLLLLGLEALAGGDGGLEVCREGGEGLAVGLGRDFVGRGRGEGMYLFGIFDRRRRATGAVFGRLPFLGGGLWAERSKVYLESGLLRFWWPAVGLRAGSLRGGLVSHQSSLSPILITIYSSSLKSLSSDAYFHILMISTEQKMELYAARPSTSNDAKAFKVADAFKC